MKFSWGSAEWPGSYGIIAEPDKDMDGVPPVSQLLMDMGVNDLSVSKRVVAGVLAFQAFIGAQVSTENEMPRLVANAISDFFGDRKVSTSGITDTPVRAWPSSGTLHVVHGCQQVSGVNLDPMLPHDYVLRLFDSATHSGVLSSPHEASVATNVFTLNRVAPSAYCLPGLSIAVALVLSDDLHMRTIRYVGPGDDRKLHAYQRLVRATGVNLSWVRQ